MRITEWSSLPRVMRYRGLSIVTVLSVLIVSAVYPIQVMAISAKNSDYGKKVSNNSEMIVQEQRTVRGTVTSADDNSTLPGVNIIVQGTSQGTTTDVDGNYSLNIPSGDVTLVFSYVGFQTEMVPVNSQTVLDVALTTDITSLNEVIVVGYGTQKKSSVTGAISSVSSEELAALPTVDLSQSLQGRASGVLVTNNGAPGTSPIVRIRGVGTINNANPLYVVDGVPYGEGTNIDPNDVESVEILKDASASAIYGSRAANGVILITTKSAKSERVTINIDSYVGVQKAWRELDMLNSEQYIDYANDLLDGDLPERIENGLDEPIYEGANQTFRETETDWQDEMFRSAMIQQHRFEIAKGGDVSKVYISGGYFDQEGIMIGTNFKRGNVRVNSEHKLNDRITVGQTLYGTFSKRRAEIAGGSIGTNIRYIVASIPYLPVYNPFNDGGFFGPQSVDGSDPTQPVRNALLNNNTITSNSLFATGYLNVKIFDWLTYRFQAGVNIDNTVNSRHDPSFDSGPGGYASKPFADVTQSKATYYSPIFTNTLTFEKTFGDHFINAVVVGEKQTSYWNNLFGGGINSITNQIDIPRGLESPRVDAQEIETAIISFAGRINYEYKNKYLIGASFRRDGSSKFAPGKKWGNFPAFSAGWRISEERFMSDVNFITELKIRGSYGVVGNNNIGDYAYQATLTNNNYYQFDATSSILTQGYTINQLANQDLRWEKMEMLNIGLDIAVLDNRVTLSTEYFDNTTDDMILSVPLPSSMGYDQPPLANVGSVQNKGFEWNLGIRSRAGAGFQWNASANMSIVDNEVLSLGQEGNTLFSANWYGDNITRTEAGEPIAYFYGYEVDGIFQNQNEIDAANNVDGDPTTLFQENAAPGDLKFRDINGDGLIDANDKTKIGHFLPDFTYGINFGANWKNFDATLFIQGSQGNEIFTTVKYHLEGMTRLFNAGTAVLDRWTEEGQNTDIPRAVGGDPNLNSRASTRFVEDGSYMRIKNLTIGYSLPNISSITNNSVTKLRMYLSTTNLFTWTKYESGYDPEIGSFEGTGTAGSLQNGIDFGQYPQPRVITLGLQVGF